MYEYVNFEELKGKVLVDIKGLKEGNDVVRFITNTGETYRMFHFQECCEYVSIEDVCGSVSNLIGSEILMAEEAVNPDDKEALRDWDESYTWTFYKLATVKGYVTIRWYGTSNGFYSERVDFVKEENLS